MATFKKLKQITLPVLKLAKGQARYIFCLGAMYEGKKMDDKKDPATLLHAVDMETGEEGLIICPMIMQKELRESYPNAGYVGKGFELVVTKAEGVKYNHVTLCEVAPPDDFVPPTIAQAEADSTTPAAKPKK